MPETPTQDGTPPSNLFETVHTWWERLEENRGDRAELRRCRSIDEVLLTESYHKLRSRVAAQGHSFSDEQLGAVAGILAHVHEDAPEASSFATQMAAPKSGREGARVSGLRFRRLLRHETREALYGPLIRVVRLLDRRVNVRSLARDVFYWGNDRRKRWALDYYEDALEEA